MKTVIYISIVFFQIVHVLAQGFGISNGTFVKVASNTNLVISSVGINNDGNITNGSNSSIVFRGSSIQEINRNNNIVFEKLIIDNSANDVVLKRNVDVNNSVDFQDGKIDLKDNNVTLGTNAQVLNENNNNRFYATDGLGIPGEGNGTITTTRDNPSGNIANLGLTIDLSGNGSTTIVRGHKALQGSGNSSGNYSVLRYFNIYPVSNGGGNKNITFEECFTDELNGHSNSDLVLYQWVDDASTGDENWVSLNSGGQALPITETSISNSLNYLKLTLGSKVSPLPVELVDFNVKTLNTSSVDVLWVTSSEINNDYFTIEKSKDLHNWEAVSFVDGAGNSNKTINYSYIDNYPFEGVNYYRLKQTDFDGNYKYEDIKYVVFNSEVINLKLYPNPASEYVIVENTEPITSYQVIDNVGNVCVGNNSINTSNKIKINIQNLSSGLYNLKIFINNAEYSKTFVKY